MARRKGNASGGEAQKKGAQAVNHGWGAVWIRTQRKERRRRGGGRWVEWNRRTGEIRAEWAARRGMHGCTFRSGALRRRWVRARTRKKGGAGVTVGLQRDGMSRQVSQYAGWGRVVMEVVIAACTFGAVRRFSTCTILHTPREEEGTEGAPGATAPLAPPCSGSRTQWAARSGGPRAGRVVHDGRRKVPWCAQSALYAGTRSSSARAPY